MATPSDTQIAQRRLAYGCCLGNYTYLKLRAEATGDTALAAEMRRKQWLLHWGWTVMMQYAIAGEEKKEMCVSGELACCVMRKVDPICVKPCKPASGSVSVVDCTPNAIEVFRIIDLIELGPPPAGSQDPGRFFVASDTGNPWPGFLLTWDGANYIDLEGPFDASYDGNIYTDGTLYYIILSGGVSFPLYPTITVSFTGIPNVYLVESDAPLVAISQGRVAQIEASSDGGTTWTVVAIMDESDIAYGITINTASSGIINPTDFRVRYSAGGCVWPYQPATFNNTPPYSLVWLGTNGSPNSSIFRGQLQDPVPFPVEATSANPPTVIFSSIRRDNLSAQGAGALVATGNGSLGQVTLLSSADEGDTWGVPLGNWATSPLAAGVFQIGTTVQWATEAGSVCIVAGTPKTLLMSTDSGVTFDYLPQNSGLQGISEEIVAAAAFTASEYLVATRRSIWRTTDGGATYTKVLNILTTYPSAQIANLQIADDVVLAFFDEGTARSANRGATWNAMNTAHIFYGGLASVMVSDCFPRNSAGNINAKRLVAGTHYSDDYGLSWNAPPAGHESKNFIPVLVSRDIAVLSTFTGSSHYLYIISTGTITQLYPAYPNGPTGSQFPWSIEAKVFQ